MDHFSCVCVFLAISSTVNGLNIDDILKSSEKVFNESLQSKFDLEEIQYVTSTLDALNKLSNVEDTKKKGVCEALKSSTTSEYFNHAKVNKLLKCGLKMPVDLEKSLEAITTSNSIPTTMSLDQLHTIVVSASLYEKNNAKLISPLTAYIKPKITTSSKPLAIEEMIQIFDIISTFSKKISEENFKFVSTFASDVVRSQSEEVNGEYLRFNDGNEDPELVTCKMLTALHKLNIGLTEEQGLMFFKFLDNHIMINDKKAFMNFHLTSALKAIHSMTNGASAMVKTSNNLHLKAGEKLQFDILDLLGGQQLADLEVFVESVSAVMPSGVESVDFEREQQIKKSGDVYKFDIQKFVESSGATSFTLAISATQLIKTEVKDKNVKTTKGKKSTTPPSTTKIVRKKLSLVGNGEVSVHVKSRISIQNSFIGIVSSSTSLNNAKSKKMLTEVNHPNMLKSNVLNEGKEGDKLVVQFSVVNARDKHVRPQQVFVRFESANHVINYLVTSPSHTEGEEEPYKLEIDLAASSKSSKRHFMYNSEYSIHIVAGDVSFENSIDWKVVSDFKVVGHVFNDFDKPSKDASPTFLKAEIHHLFREPELRPPPSVTRVFTILCLLPVVVMLGGWLWLGVVCPTSIISFFSTPAPSLVFHASLGATFWLYYLFWTQINMFTTVKYLVLLMTVLFLSGQRILAYIANEREDGGSDKSGSVGAASSNSVNDSSNINSMKSSS